MSAGYFAVGYVNAAALLALLSSVLEVGLFLAVRALPLRALDQTLGALANTNSQFDAALNNMSQGLLLFDSNTRIAVVNRKYIEMYGLSPDVVKPGLRFIDLIRHRKETGCFHGDVEQYCADIDAALARGKATSLIADLPGGRSILIVNQPIAAGGWIATHEDITERQALLLARDEAVRQLREQKVLLDTALNNMAHGLCMFDAQGRLILFNQRYCEMMQLPAESLLGRSLLDLMKSAQVDRRIHARPRTILFDTSSPRCEPAKPRPRSWRRAADARCASSIIRWRMAVG